ncbi:MAG: hypothetical protein LJE59_03990 [Chromatiaceae bacterium]|nr:hypothetical protein [Chromatiaceae bacterium]
MRMLLNTLARLLVFGTCCAALADEQVIDFTNQIAPVCKVRGLQVAPPKGWFNVPIESAEAAVQGCQMMRTGEQDELLGILRVVALDIPESEDATPWWAFVIALEQQVVNAMGYQLGEVLWTRQKVPIAGDGFSEARAVGLQATIEGNDNLQEVHFLVFKGPFADYGITLATPAKSVGAGSYYARNTADFGLLIRSLQPWTGDTD